MIPSMRLLRDDDDYWRIRAFLREVFLLNKRQELSWQTARLDYWRYFGNVHIEHYALNEAICIFEAGDGCFAGIVTPESRANAYLNVHPKLRTRDLEFAMVQAAEAHLAERDEKGDYYLTVWAHQHDDLRKQVLLERGYSLGDWPEVQRSRSLCEPIPDPNPAPGYSIRSLGDDSEHPARSWVSWRAFHPDEPHENYHTWSGSWYLDIQRCPMYRRDLDLVAVAPNGELAAFTTVWYDDVTRTGYFEPVGTSPAHQRKGLARAVMYEGMHRLKRIGAVHATVAGYSEAANALYTSVIGPDCLVYERWQKRWIKHV